MDSAKYLKAEYDDLNQYLATGHKNGISWGNSLLIVAAKASVEKGKEQKIGNEEKKTYDLDAGQRYVDYVLTPKLEALNAAYTFEGTTSVILTDTLPKGLTYVENSSYIGGTYVPDTISGTIEGGQYIEPDSVTVNGDGSTTIVWTIHGVRPGKDIPKLHFKAYIGLEAVTGQSFVNKADIKSPISAPGNTATAELDVVKLSGASFAKSSDTPMVEKDGRISYTLIYTNSSLVDMNDVTILDILPYQGDGRGTNFNGVLKVDSIEVDLSKAEGTTTSDIYMTTAIEERGSLAENVNLDNYTKIHATGTLSISQELTGLAWNGNVKAGETVTIKLTMDAKSTSGKSIEAGSVFCNAATAFDGKNSLMTPYSITGVPDRTISGTVWIDKNQDGIIDGDENILPGVKVTLWIYDEDSDGYVKLVKDYFDNPITSIMTDEDGYYELKNLPEGRFKVTFESGDEDISLYDVTNTGNNKEDEETTVTKRDDLLEIGAIEGIILNPANKMKNRIEYKTERNLGLNSEDIKVIYQWIGELIPGDVNVPNEDTIGKGTAYDSKTQSPTNENYEFHGWYIDEACTIPYEEKTILTTDTILYGNWTKTQITVDYKWVSEDNPKDVSEPIGDSLNKGTAYISKTQDNTAEKYTFEGWFLDKECMVPYEDGMVLTENTTLYGKWIKINTFIKYPDQIEVSPGDVVNYTFANFENKTGNTVSNYEISDFPEKGLNFESVMLPAFNNGAGITYNIWYMTNNRDWQLLKDSVDASAAVTISAPRLESGEYVTGIKFTFGSVPGNFAKDNLIQFVFQVDESFTGEKIINTGQCAYKPLKGNEVVNKSDATVRVLSKRIAGLPRTGGILGTIGMGLLSLGTVGVLYLKKRK